LIKITQVSAALIAFYAQYNWGLKHDNIEQQRCFRLVINTLKVKSGNIGWGGVLTMGDKSPKNTQKMKKNAEKKVTAPKPSTAPESKPK